MPIVACDLPDGTAIEQAMLDHADFRDSHRVRLTRTDRLVTDLFLAIFGHRPWWMTLALLLRHRFGAAIGLTATPSAELMRVTATPAVGGTIGGWPVFVLNDQELVAGRDNAHLDFRLSILTEHQANGTDLIVSTVCRTHNRFGRIYLAVIAPFHRFGIRLLIRRALAGGRL